MERQRKRCAIDNCKRRIDASDRRFRIGMPSLYPYFEIMMRNQNQDPNKYSKKADICSKCHFKAKKHQLARPRPPVLLANVTPPESEISEDEVEMVPESDAEMEIVHSNQPESSLGYCSSLSEVSSSTLESRSGSVISGEEFSQSQNSVTMSQYSTHTQANTVFLNTGDMKTIAASEKACCICNSRGVGARSRIPVMAVRDLAISRNILVPMSNRCCSEHLTESQTFTDDSKLALELQNNNVIQIESMSKWVQKVVSTKGPKLGFDFDTGNGLDYELVTGLTKEQFEILMEDIESSNIRSSVNRSKRQALGAVLMLLRTGQSQRYIGYQLGLEQRVVSEAIDSASTVLEELFCKKFLGINHITREEAIHCHGRRSCNLALGIPEGSLVLVADGTYFYIEKPMDHCEQRLSYSDQKKRNFVRFIAVTTPDGYTVDTFGPYPANKNDAECFYDIWSRPDFREFCGENCHLILDRGFRDFERRVTEEGAKVTIHMPSFLSKAESQFTQEEANSSRCVTFNRWTVEAQHGIVKQKYKLLMNTIPGRYSDKVPRLVRIAEALKNAFTQVPFTESDEHLDRARNLREKTKEKSGDFKQRLEFYGLMRKTTKWERLNSTHVENFPKISLQELKDNITFGVYQLRQALFYIREHLSDTGEFELLLHMQYSNIIRVEVHSRFSISRSHTVWIEFDPDVDGYKSVENYHCSCKQGGRTAGCCSHTAAVLRYLGHDRYLQEDRMRASKRIGYILTEKIRLPANVCM